MPTKTLNAFIESRRQVLTNRIEKLTDKISKAMDAKQAAVNELHAMALLDQADEQS